MLLVRRYLPVLLKASSAEQRARQFHTNSTCQLHICRQHIAQLPSCKPTVGKLPPRVNSPDLGDNGWILILMFKHSCSNYL